MASTSVKFSYKRARRPQARIAPVVSEPPRAKVAIRPAGVKPKKPGKTRRWLGSVSYTHLAEKTNQTRFQVETMKADLTVAYHDDFFRCA